MNHPVVLLGSGLRVANFSSPHPFQFDSGETLDACAAEVSRALMLDARETVTTHALGFEDIELVFAMTDPVFDALAHLADDESIDVILVPLPVMSALKSLPKGYPPLTTEHIRSKVRVCRVADRVTKTICSRRFCR